MLKLFLIFFAGTERCNEALQKLEKKYDVVVNIQGDEPLIEPEIIDGVVKALQVFFLFLFFLKKNSFWENTQHLHGIIHMYLWYLII